MAPGLLARCDIAIVCAARSTSSSSEQVDLDLEPSLPSLSMQVSDRLVCIGGFERPGEMSISDEVAGGGCLAQRVGQNVGAPRRRLHHLGSRLCELSPGWAEGTCRSPHRDGGGDAARAGATTVSVSQCTP